MLFQTQKLTLPSITTKPHDDYTAKGGLKENLKPSAGSSGASGRSFNGPPTRLSSVGASIVFKNNNVISYLNKNE